MFQPYINLVNLIRGNFTNDYLAAGYVQNFIREIGYRTSLADDERGGYAITLKIPAKEEHPESLDAPYGKGSLWKEYREKFCETDVVVTETRETNRFAYEQQDGTKQPPYYNAIFPGEPGFSEKLWEAISPARDELTFWFEEFSQERVSFNRLKTLCEELKPRIIAYSEEEDKWSPNMGLSFPQNNDLRSYALTHCIISSFFRGEGHNFERIKRCRFCEKFFWEGRKGREFCSDGCRNKNSRLQK